MKKSRKTTITVVALLLIVVAACGIAYTNAKYTTSKNGNVSTSVAKWFFNVSANDSYSDANTIDGLKIAQTCDEKTLVNGKIAPGTSGNFDIVVNADESEVGLEYVVTFTEENSRTLPTNLKMTLDGKEWSLADGISGKIDANASSKEVTHTISWTWDYETANGDIADTTDGTNGFDYTYTVEAIGTQVRPVAK